MKNVTALALVVSTIALVIAFRALNSRAVVLQSLQGGLAQAQADLHKTEAKLSEVSARLSEVEKRYALAPQPASTVVTTAHLPLLAAGSYTVEHDAVVYDWNASLRVWDRTAVRSPTGVMVSDLDQRMIAGDLTMETPTSTLQAEGAALDVRAKTVTAKRLTFRAKKEE
jgi:hypothetical protein